MDSLRKQTNNIGIMGGVGTLSSNTSQFVSGITGRTASRGGSTIPILNDRASSTTKTSEGDHQFYKKDVEPNSGQ